jgi:hypothetical protein
MAENAVHQPDAFKAFVVLFRYAESQAKRNLPDAAVDYDPAAIINALRKLYNSYPDPQSHYLNAPRLQAGLEQILAQTGQENLLGNLEVSENLQIVGLLLDTILADTAIPCGVTPYFRRLQFPLLIAALADPKVLEGATHPARELLDQLAHLSLAANAQGQIDNAELLQSLEQALSVVSVDTASRTVVFAEASAALAKLIAPLLKSFALRLERVIDTCKGGHRLDQARLLVVKEIDARLGGKTVPKTLLELLAAGWQQLLVLTCLRQNIDDEEWRRELSVVDQLMARVGDEAPSDPSQVEVMTQFIVEKLHGVGAEPSFAKRLAGEIEALMLNDSGKNALDYVTVPPANTEWDEKEALLRTRLQGFSVGDWLKFSSTRNVWVPFRLTWIGHDPARYVFVNQKGVKSLYLDAEKFVQILDEMRASRIESLEEFTLVERAAKSLLYTLRERMR